jgi:ABC-2 type transport system permease protein
MNNILQIKQLFRLISAIFYEMIREPGVLFWGIVFPILMSLGLGVAFTNTSDVTRKIAIVETGQISDTVSAINSINNVIIRKSARINAGNGHPCYYRIVIQNKKLGNTTFLFQKTTWKNAMVLLKRGNISVVISEKNNQLEYNFDPSNPDAQLSYLKLSNLFNHKVAGLSDYNESIKPLTVNGTRYIDFLVPGLIAMGIMMSCMWGISYGIIEKRSKKLLRRLVATPMKKSYFLIALITVRFAMNFIEGCLLVVFAYFVFDFNIQGSVPALFIILIAGNIAFSGLAVFISSRTAKTEIGNGLINLVVMPMMVLSGIFFSYHNFPEWTIPIIQKFPLTMMTDDLRSVFIEGAGISEILLHSSILSLTGIVFFVVGLRIFKWH